MSGVSVMLVDDDEKWRHEEVVWRAKTRGRKADTEEEDAKAMITTRFKAIPDHMIVASGKCEELERDCG